jgi:hypothetical protein
VKTSFFSLFGGPRYKRTTLRFEQSLAQLRTKIITDPSQIATRKFNVSGFLSKDNEKIRASYAVMPRPSFVDEPPVTSDAYLVKLLKWPIVWALAFTSVPAGIMPCLAVGAYRGMQHDQQVPLKWRNPRRIESGQRMVQLFTKLSVAALIVQALLTWIFLRSRERHFLGFRGVVWLAMIWGACAAGVVLGIWIDCVAPA